MLIQSNGARGLGGGLTHLQALEAKEHRHGGVRKLPLHRRGRQIDRSLAPQRRRLPPSMLLFNLCSRRSFHRRRSIKSPACFCCCLLVGPKTRDERSEQRLLHVMSACDWIYTVSGAEGGFICLSSTHSD